MHAAPFLGERYAHIAKSTAHHHLTLLRSAVLVHMVDDLYNVDRDIVPQLGQQLADYRGITWLQSEWALVGRAASCALPDCCVRSF